ncbi:lytic transglycosylase domain-containing protein [Albirhodobacter sp. R86504]|jgi:membrane-bound lytic murein transglycosylase B|uniref:lytic transglycosylase domain-containing protein n=1 Tax=Albirhodobacter sp. R86504 TaxID=3093848 RepID=UPI00366BE4D4
MRKQALSLLLCAAFWAERAVAETAPQLGPVATIKRIGVPKAGQKKLLTIQIDPEEQARALASLPAWVEKSPVAASAPTGPRAPAAYDWYWKAVSPALGDVSGRFTTAISALGQGPGGSSVAAPRLAHLQTIAQSHGREILAATIGTNVSPALVLAVIGIESGGKIDAVSSAGAQGLMQLIPATAERFAVSDSNDPKQNIKGGVAYLDWLMKEFDNDPLMVLAAYNAGEGAVRKAGGVPDYVETRNYVPKVLAAWNVARGLCLSPPELVSDGCVFALKG